ncbi:MAG: dihydrodipicolinate reductase, partial [Anaerolineae bacterium]
NLEAYVKQERVRTIHYGIGAIGAEVVRLVLNRPDIEIVGAIDAHPAKAGRDLGEATGVGHPLGIKVSYDPEPVLKDVYADVVIHATASSLTMVYPQLLQIVSAEKSVISSCEELAFPWIRYPDISQKLDRRARETGVRILGTGVNPGFVMDTLPLALATVCQQIKSIRVTRIVDVGKRRLQLQAKVGVGLTGEGFQKQTKGGALGHVGLRESVFMIADTLGWRLDDIAEAIEPVIARERMKTDYFSVDKRQVAGLRQTARGLMAGREVVRLELEMSVGAKNPHDAIVIDGKPPVNVTIPDGIQGDQATAAIMANCIPAIAHSRAVGLLSMRDMPIVPYLRPRPQPREEMAD